MKVNKYKCEKVKAKPKTNGLITINGDKGCVVLHVNQAWQAEKLDNEYRIEHKFLSLYVDTSLFEKMFKIVN